MKFITEKQFESVNGVVQGELYQWWKETMGIGDLAYNSMYGGVLCITEEIEYTTRDIMIDNTTPILTEGQLIQFIEFKLGERIDIFRAETKGHTIATNYIDFEGKCKYMHETRAEQLIDALWEVAQAVAARN